MWHASAQSQRSVTRVQYAESEANENTKLKQSFILVTSNGNELQQWMSAVVNFCEWH